MSRSITRHLAVGAIAALCLAGCGGSEPPAIAIHLVDHYSPEALQDEFIGRSPRRERTEWRFDGDAPGGVPEELAATRGWEAGHAVAGLAVRDGRLTGKSSGPFPILRVERTQGLDHPDLLHAVEVRMRVSGGANLAVLTSDSETVDFEKILAKAKDFPWTLSGPVVPGEEFRTYTLRPARPIRSSAIRHLLLRPTDAAGVTFELQSLRLIFRKEHLSGIPSGVGWQGLGEIYHESLVARAPEIIRFNLRLPSRPWLDLSLGTIEDGPVTFQVGVRRTGGELHENLLERTVTRSYRWQPAPVDLSSFADEEVELSLSLSAEHDGTLGFWGAPVVRSRGAMPRVTAPSTSGGEPPQGVILIWVDTLRRDHLDVYGYGRNTSPALRKMSEEGTLFQDCTVQATWTKVSTPSLLTSLYPSSHGVREFSDRLPVSANTLAESYRAAGYATLSLSSIMFTGQFTNLHQGFEVVHEDGSLPDQGSSKTAREYVDRLLPWLDRHQDVPFFVFLHIADPHDPYKPYAPYDTMWADPAWAEEHEKNAEHVGKFIANPLMKMFGMPNREEIEKAGLDADEYIARDGDWYDGSIRGMDAEIGRLLQHLRGLGLAERTLVVLTSDHGEEFLEHGHMFHGQSVYGELTNVPLILWRPGSVPGGLVVRETVQTVDLMPTLLEMSGLAGPEGMQGRSLVPLLAGSPAAAGVQAAEAGGSRFAIAEKATIEEEGIGGPPPHDTGSLAITQDGWKLIHNHTRRQGTPEFELYHQDADPLNLTDLAAQHPERVAEMKAVLDAWQEKALAARLVADSEAERSMSQQELERLRSLGYVQ